VLSGLLLAACSSTTTSASTKPASSDFCAAARGVQTANAKPLPPAVTAAQSKTRSQRQLAAVKAAASPSERRNLDVALRHDCKLSADIFGIAVAATVAPAPGTVTGTLRMVGGPAPGENLATAGTVTATPEEGGTSVAAHTDSAGRFVLRLPADSYRLSGRSPRYHGICNGDGVVMVRASATVGSDVYCQMK
jgi:hypothetical protein